MRVPRPPVVGCQPDLLHRLVLLLGRRQRPEVTSRMHLGARDRLRPRLAYRSVMLADARGDLVRSLALVVADPYLLPDLVSRGPRDVLGLPHAVPADVIP